MQARKTHEQQLKIIEKREGTSNAGVDFDIDADLARRNAAKTARDSGDTLRPDVKNIGSDRGMMRGENKEGHHHTRSGAGN